MRLNVVDAAAMHRRLVEGSREWLRQWQQARVRRPRHIYAETGLTPPHLGLGTPRSTSALGLRSPLPHLHRYWAHPCRIGIGDGLTLLHLHRDRVRPRHSAAGLIPATSGLGSRPPHLRRDWARARHICPGTGLTPAASAPGLGSAFGPVAETVVVARRMPRVTLYTLHAIAACGASRCTRCTQSLHAARRVVACPRVVCVHKRIAGARRPSRPRAVGWCSGRRSTCAGPSDRATLRGRPTSPPRSALKARKRLRRSWVLRSTRILRDCKYYSSALRFRTTADMGFGSHHPSERLPTVGCV
jgi:hypothetical protein